MFPHRLLCISRDPYLLHSRVAILASQYSALGVRSVDEMSRMAGHNFDLILLGHTLSEQEREAAIAAARAQWPHARILEICRPGLLRDPAAVDAQVNGLDGPLALLRSVRQLLPPADSGAHDRRGPNQPAARRFANPLRRGPAARGHQTGPVHG